MKMTVAMIGAALALAGCSGGESGNDAGGSSEPAAAAKPVVEVTAKELAKAYEANEQRAQQTYGGKRLAVTGIVAGVDLDFANDPVVKLASNNEFMPVQAAFTKADSEKTAKLDKGQKIVVTCDEISEVVGTPMLSECSLP